MQNIWRKIVDASALLLSMYFQYVEKQAIIIACIFFISLLAAQYLTLKLSKEKVTFKSIFDNSLLRAFGLFLCGTLTIALFSSVRAKIDDRQQKALANLQKDTLEVYISQTVISKIAMDEVEKTGVVPNVSWCEENGIDNEKGLADLICGLYNWHSQPSDYEKARNHFKIASSKSALAKYYYGLMVYYGFGDQQNHETGYQLITEAAEAQVLDAQIFVLNKGIIDNNHQVVERWYHTFINADCTEIKVPFNNNHLFDFYDAAKEERAHKVYSEFQVEWFENRWNLYRMMSTVLMNSGRPFEACKICDEYFSYYDKDGDFSLFANDLKHEILLRTGNIRQARKYEGKGLIKSKNDWRALNNSITINHSRDFMFMILREEQ